MDPHAELARLVGLFPQIGPLFAAAEHIPASETPEPYKSLLVHDHHMTVTMETHHQCRVAVEVLNSRLDGDIYAREIRLRNSTTSQIVMYGLVRLDLNYVTAQVGAEIVAGQQPLGQILIDHNVLRHIDLGAILQFTAGPMLADRLQMPERAITYGRLATIFCNRRPAVDLLEISAPFD